MQEDCHEEMDAHAVEFLSRKNNNNNNTEQNPKCQKFKRPNHNRLAKCVYLFKLYISFIFSETLFLSCFLSSLSIV